MIRFSPVLALLSAAFIVGCSTSADVAVTPAGSAEAVPAGITVHKNAAGKVFCPIMKAEIEDPSKAVGYVDHEGTRYYMCCESCLERAKADPSILSKASAS